MILHDCQQGTQRWLELRAGRPTSSEFDKIITPAGAASKSASGYCNKLLVEVMLGRPLIGIEMPWMTRGKEMEERAVIHQLKMELTRLLSFKLKEAA